MSAVRAPIVFEPNCSEDHQLIVIHLRLTLLHPLHSVVASYQRTPRDKQFPDDPWVQFRPIWIPVLLQFTTFEKRVPPFELPLVVVNLVA